MDHWPIKIVDRKSTTFITWGCEACNETFQSKAEFNAHIIKETKKPVFENLLHQGESNESNG